MDALDVFHTDIPGEYLKTLRLGLQHAYTMAHRHVTSMWDDGLIQWNGYPWVRRQFVEQLLIGHDQLYEGMTARHVSGNFWDHVEIRIGRVVLTQSACSDDVSPLRPALYKARLAIGTQKLLFPDFQDIPDEAELYGVILHKKSAADPSRLGYATIRFPRADSSDSLCGFYAGDVDLMAGFDELSFDQPAEEVIDEAPLPVLKQLKKVDDKCGPEHPDSSGNS